MPEEFYKSDDLHKRLSMKVKKDVFYEMSVNNPTSSANAIYAIYMVLCVICGICSFLVLLSGGIMDPILLILAVIAGFLCAMFSSLAQRVRVEYDYTLTNGTLDIARITNEKKRKKIVSLDVTAILEMRSITDEGFQVYFEDKEVKVVDATCPFVKKIHKIVEENSSEGRSIIIVGDEHHPEVQGIRGWSVSETYVIENKEDVNNLTINNDRICVVTQTTFNHKKYGEIIEAIHDKYKDSNIIEMNTICNATNERQEAAIALAKESDVMIVIGGKNSSNTQKLYAICKKECNNTFYIQKSSDLDFDKIDSDAKVGITAGASTPNTIIKEVFDICQR